MEATDIEHKLLLDLKQIDDRKLFSYDNYNLTIEILKREGVNFSIKVMICIDEIQLLSNIPRVI